MENNNTALNVKSFTEQEKNTLQQMGFLDLAKKLKTHIYPENRLLISKELLQAVPLKKPLTVGQIDRYANSLFKALFKSLSSALIEVSQTIMNEEFYKNKILDVSIKFYFEFLSKFENAKNLITLDFWNECINDGVSNYEKSRKNYQGFVERILTRTKANHTIPERTKTKNEVLQPQHTQHSKRKKTGYNANIYALVYVMDCKASNTIFQNKTQEQRENALYKIAQKKRAKSTLRKALQEVATQLNNSDNVNTLTAIAGDDWKTILFNLSTNKDALNKYLSKHYLGEK